MGNIFVKLNYKIDVKRWRGVSRQTSDDSVCNERKVGRGTHVYRLCGLEHHNLATGLQAMKSLQPTRGLGTSQWLNQ